VFPPAGAQHRRALEKAATGVDALDAEVVVVERKHAKQEDPATKPAAPQWNRRRGELSAARSGHAHPRRQLVVDALKRSDARPHYLRRRSQPAGSHDLNAGHIGHLEARPSVFFSTATLSDYLDRDLAHLLGTPKKREALPDVLDRKELARRLDVPAREGVWERVHAGKLERDRLLLALFAYSGLRRSELLGLDWDDVDLERRLIRVRNAKGSRQRVVPIHPGLVPLFLACAATRSPTGDPALFVGVLGRRLSPTILSVTFRRYTDAAGVAKRKRITPHTLRHVVATELLSAGANLREIQELLGHKHLDSTQRYTRVNAHELRGAIKQLTWAQPAAMPSDDAHHRQRVTRAS
jgi:site-specific recombinase XerD